MSLWQEGDNPGISVEEQKEIARRLGLSEQEILDDPYLFRKELLSFLLEGAKVKLEEGQNDAYESIERGMTISERINFKNTVVDLLKVLGGRT